MKLQIVSDLHLEFGDIEIPNVGTDLLILSGDITVAADLESPRAMVTENTNKLFNQVCRDFKNVIYVLGNHEHYHGNFAFSTEILTRHLSHFPNLHILDTSSVVIDDIVFVGGTLWTDFKRNDPIVKWDAARMMNDYRSVYNGEVTIGGSSCKFIPEDALMYHNNMLAYIDAMYIKETWSPESPRKMVVVGHHAPSFQSISGRYVGDRLNGAYASDLTDFIVDRPMIKLWTHGHVHTTSDYMINSCRIVANPRGYYGYEENPQFDPGKVIEI
jgi:Icc-related predicted phosphoesterase